MVRTQRLTMRRKVGERDRNRTYNLWIKSPLLCQLSYAPSDTSFLEPPPFMSTGSGSSRARIPMGMSNRGALSNRDPEVRQPKNDPEVTFPLVAVARRDAV